MRAAVFVIAAGVTLMASIMGYKAYSEHAEWEAGALGRSLNEFNEIQRQIKEGYGN
jgi:hypothetical protein